jgi:hypothetical protein
MTTWAIRMSLLTLACALIAALAGAPAAAQDQTGAEQEYNLDLPGSGANADTPPASSAGSEDSDSGGFPVLAVAIVGGAGVAAGFAVWRLRHHDEPEAPGGDPGPDPTDQR